MNPARELDVAELAARLAAGDAIDLDSIDPALRDEPRSRALLSFARVASALDRNYGTATATTPRTAPKRIGPWQLVRLLGSGGMGDVWLGERVDGAVEQRVAIKRVRSGARAFNQRLEAERRILARLTHPNIARFIDAGVDDDGAPWLALEYVDGVALTDWLDAAQPSLRERLALFLAIAGAVEHAHRHLIVHRDLKPANMLVEHNGTPRLLDFGIARLLDGSASDGTTLSLTPAYASPEQLRGGDITTATDVYALGLILYRILAFALPETRDNANVATLLACIDVEETCRPSQTARRSAVPLPYPPDALTGDLDAIVQKALRAEPDARYLSVAAFADDIERHLALRPVLARAPTRRYLVQRWIKRNRLAVALGSVAFLAMLAGTGIALWQAQRATAAAARAETQAAIAQRELSRAERVSEFLAALYREQDPLSRGGAQALAPQALIKAAVDRVDRELAGDPLTAARLLSVLGEAELNLGELTRANATLERGRTLALAASAPLLAAEIDAIAGELALRELRQDDAEALFARALATVEAAGRGDSVDAARIEARRAISLVYLGKFKQARGAAERADMILSRELAPDSTERIGARVVLGIILEQLRDDAAARTTLEDAIAAIEAALGTDDARLIQPLQSLGEVLRRARAFDAGRERLGRGVAIARRAFGDSHVTVSNILVRLATLERDAGDPQRAIALLDEAEGALPDAEINVRAQLLASRGGTWIELDDGARAETDLREALRLRRATGGLKTGIAWFTQSQLGEALMLQGRLDEALALQREAARELEALLGPDAYQNALIAQRLAKTFDARGEFAAAAATWRRSAQLVEKTYGLDHFGHLDMASRLADALARTPDGRDEALALADSLLARWADKDDVGDRVMALRALRCELAATAADRDAARALLDGLSTDIDKARRQRLERCAQP